VLVMRGVLAGEGGGRGFWFHRIGPRVQRVGAGGMI
jgi:hypothetical protein